MAKDPTGNLTNHVLAQRPSVSERHLAGVFRAHTGNTPARWLERIRVDSARIQLEKAQSSIDEIALPGGFKSVETFRQAFQRVMHMTPVHHPKLHATRRQ